MKTENCVATYKLRPEQRDEVNTLIEEAQNDSESVLFKLVAQRDEARAQVVHERAMREQALLLLHKAEAQVADLLSALHLVKNVLNAHGGSTADERTEATIIAEAAIGAYAAERRA